MNTENDYDRKLFYIINLFESYVDDLLWNVIYDDQDNPETSAVAVANCIKCIISVKQHLNISCEYVDQTSFIISKGLSSEQAQKFEELRKKEAEYYEGIQF